MFEKFDIDDKNIFKVCIVATMSSGKSTFINSIIGDEIMPEKNEACTARTMAVLDNDTAALKRAHIIRRNGAKEVVEINNRNVLDRVNNDEDVMDFLVETNIQSIQNTRKALMLVDTPGVNNSGDERHGERTEEFLKQMDHGVIIYLLNATQLATNDDSILLQLVSEHIKRQNGSVKILFVINKIDALDEETESIAGTVRNAKEYIQDHGIQNPVIYPLSALAAKSLRMILYHRELTKRELRRLDDIYDHYRPRDNNMLEFAILDDISEETYGIGDRSVSAQQLRRAIDNTGITAIEKQLEKYMLEDEKYYTPDIVIKTQMSETATQKIQSRLDCISSISSYLDQCDWEEFKRINQELYDTKPLQKANDNMTRVDSVSVRMDMSINISASSERLDDLMVNIERSKQKLFDLFAEGMYVSFKWNPGLYFCPEIDEKDRISAKNFYLMSEDGIEWSTVHFGRVTSLIENGTDFFLYNDSPCLIFKVTSENGTDIVPLLDVKIPAKFVKIAGLKKEKASFKEVETYIGQIVSEEQARQQEVENAQKKLQRTYKGIVFDTEEQKNIAIELDKELEKYCRTLTERSYEELWNKREEITNFSSTLFASYLSNIILAMSIQEERDKKQYLTVIKDADLPKLDRLIYDLGQRHYSDTIKQEIGVEIEKRRLSCQRDILEASVKDIDLLSRAGLRELEQTVHSKKFDFTLTEEYVGRIHNRNDVLEERELRALCADIEQQDIDELEKLEVEIRNGGYQDKFTGKYFDMIYAAIEAIHMKRLTQYCISINSVGRRDLELISKQIDEEDCKPELKKTFYEQVQRREEHLDYEDLCALTADITDKSLQNLEELYRLLQNGQYNQKFIKRFLVEVRMALECARVKKLDEMLATLDTMEKSQVIELQERIKELGYEERITFLARKKIDERCYELDMYELMALENNFDRLDLADINELRNRVKRRNVCERSRATYLKKLQERELAYAYREISPAACFVQQLLNQSGLNGAGFKVATFSPDYIQYLNEFVRDTGKCDYDDLPVFFFPECKFMTITRTDLYYKADTGFNEIRLTDIRSIVTEKKMFKISLIITMLNGNVFALSGGLSKEKSDVIVKTLTIIVKNLSNEALLSRYQPYQHHVAELCESDFEYKPIPAELTDSNIIDILLTKYKERGFRSSVVKAMLQDNWRTNEMKVRKGFGITDEQRIVLYCSDTLINSVRAGIAFGVNYIHIKQEDQRLVSVPYSDIYEITGCSGKLVITTVFNIFYSMGFNFDKDDPTDKLAELLNEYMRGIQLIRYLKNVPEVRETYTAATDISAIHVCTRCGMKIRPGAKFCSNCGGRIQLPDGEIEYIFCTACGNKIKKGKKFCSKCGTRVE